MGRCSYIWNEWNEKNNRLVKRQCPKEVCKSSEEYCIFHDPSPSKDANLFRQELDRKLDNKDYNFRGYYFPIDIHFSNKEFGEDVCFDGTTFQKNAYFNGTTFHRNADFYGTTFQKNAYFNGTTFQYVSFFGVIIERNLEFTPKKIGQLNLQNAKFLFKGHITADLVKAKFHGAELENVAFIDCVWPEKQIIYEELHMDDERLCFRDLETIYRNLKQNMQHYGDYSAAGEFYFREMECRKESMKKKRFSANWFKSFGYSLLKYTCGYGEKPFLVIRSSLLIIALGAILFFFCGVARTGTDVPQERDSVIDYSLDSLSLNKTTLLDFGYCIYYSVVTFTTLGYGDIHPLGLSHIFASLEAFTGAFFMALFVLVFGRKMMR